MPETGTGRRDPPWGTDAVVGETLARRSSEQAHLFPPAPTVMYLRGHASVTRRVCHASKRLHDAVLVPSAARDGEGALVGMHVTCARGWSGASCVALKPTCEDRVDLVPKQQLLHVLAHVDGLADGCKSVRASRARGCVAPTCDSMRWCTLEE